MPTEDKPPVILHPTGSPDPDELDAIVRLAKKVLGIPIEIGPKLSVPPAAVDGGRGQIVAARLIAVVPSCRPAPPPPPTHSTYGGIKPKAPPKPPPDPKSLPFARVAVTEQDLYAAGHEFIFTAADAPGRRAIMGTRRMKEAFHRRKTDPAKQRSRAAKEFLFAVATARGIQPCGSPRCVLSQARHVLDIDQKDERPCGSCNSVLRGRMRL